MLSLSLIWFEWNHFSFGFLVFLAAAAASSFIAFVKAQRTSAAILYHPFCTPKSRWANRPLNVATRRLARFTDFALVGNGDGRNGRTKYAYMYEATSDADGSISRNCHNVRFFVSLRLLFFLLLITISNGIYIKHTFFFCFSFTCCFAQLKKVSARKENRILKKYMIFIVFVLYMYFFVFFKFG